MWRCRGAGWGGAPGGEVELPEVVEGGGGGGAAAEHKHGGALRAVDGAVGVPLADPAARLLAGQAAPHQPRPPQARPEVLEVLGSHPLAAGQPPAGAGAGARHGFLFP